MELDRIDHSIGRLFDRVGCSIGLKSVRTSRSIGRLARSAGSFKWIVSSFDVKDVFVYDGLYYLSSWPIEQLFDRLTQPIGYQQGLDNMSLDRVACSIG